MNTDSRTHQPAAAVAAADLSGRTLGGYRLVRRLGSGGMADVYLGEQVSLGRHVAIKVLRPETLRHPGAVQRFEQEARAAAALVHGNIVQIHEVACIDGIHMLVEEYVAGPSLKTWLQGRGPLDTAQALTVLAQVGSALARAADRGVVHRDIKPENLLVTRAGEVKVADFGLARIASENLELTQTGMTIGTPLYMSPEQGEGHAVDIRSDLYSLGATAYHLLAGRPPYSGPTAMSVVLAHIRAPLPPLEPLRPDVPAAVRSIVERLLAKSAEERFATPVDLLRAVEAADATLAAHSRHGLSPLAWSDANGLLPTAGADAGEVALRTATQHLQAALAAGQASRASTRRRLVLTGLAALVAAGVGLAVGRRLPRRPDFVRRLR
ncbi:MAG: serine/threonine-protein kinase [Pirellulales bacterium]